MADESKPTPVAGEKRQQAGMGYLNAKCPKCGREINIAGEGLFPCHCGLVSQVSEKK
jgi:tRNA(Ile2) C34 agmatinyltransferase TiaS